MICVFRPAHRCPRVAIPDQLSEFIGACVPRGSVDPALSKASEAVRVHGLTEEVRHLHILLKLEAGAVRLALAVTAVVFVTSVATTFCDPALRCDRCEGWIPLHD